MTKTTKALIAGAAVAGLLTGALVTKSEASMKDAGTLIKKLASKANACKGQNDCKGKGGCSTGDNGCKGKNSCKGKGGCKTE
jgi:hypothetical protein